MSKHYPCPICNAAPATTSANCPSVRGFLIAWQTRNRTVIGCPTCVRKELAKEAGTSALVGWFSPTALFLNPILIAYNLVRIPFIKDNPERLARTYRQFRIPEPQDTTSPQAAISVLAVAMIAQDGKIDPEEVIVAKERGRALIPSFDMDRFDAALASHKTLPNAQDIAGLLAGRLTKNDALVVLKLLFDIAHADGRFAPDERALLHQVAGALLGQGIEMAELEHALGGIDAAPPHTPVPAAVPA